MKKGMIYSFRKDEYKSAKFHQTIKSSKDKLMKKLIFIFVLLSLFSCKDFIDKPKNLIDEKVMSEIIADLMINEQAIFTYQNKNMEAGTRFVLKAHHVKPDDFVQSFKYYIIKEKMESITNDAQEILIKKDPKADKYIKDKLKQNGSMQPLVR